MTDHATFPQTSNDLFQPKLSAGGIGLRSSATRAPGRAAGQLTGQAASPALPALKRKTAASGAPQSLSGSCARARGSLLCSDPSAPDAVLRCGSGAVVYFDPAEDSLVAVPTLCRRWDCPTCGPKRRAQAFNEARAGRPERHVVLTNRPRPDLTVEQHCAFVAVAFDRLVAHIRRTFGPFEYQRFWELHKNGAPHMHILTRGSYIPHRWLSAAWRDLTGNYIVHLSKIDHVPRAVNECVKYLLKTAQAFKKACPRRHVYTMSRGWLPDDYLRHPGREPADPYAVCPRLRLAEVLEVAAALGSTARPLPGGSGRYLLPRPRAPDPPHFDPLRYGDGERQGGLWLYLAWRWWPHAFDELSLSDALWYSYGLSCPAWTKARRATLDALLCPSVPLSVPPDADPALDLEPVCAQAPLFCAA